MHAPDDRHGYATYQTKDVGRFLSRIGVRSDGARYANGPYGTFLLPANEPRVMPKPSGAPLFDFAGIQIGTGCDHNSDAAATVSSEAAGGTHFARKVVDGEIGIRQRFAQYDWLAAGQRAGAWVDLAWCAARQVDQIPIYLSATPTTGC